MREGSRKSIIMFLKLHIQNVISLSTQKISKRFENIIENKTTKISNVEIGL